MDVNIAQLSLSDEEDAPIQAAVPLAQRVETYEFCMVGMFLTYSVVKFQPMQNTLADLWHPLGGITITDLGARRFLFRFYNEVDFERAKDGAPWFFNRHLLMWSPIGAGEDPLNVPLLFTDFWVQVYDLEPGYYTEEVATMLGNFIGEFITYDAENVAKRLDDPNAYMRIKVRLDIRKSLRRRKRINGTKGHSFFARFQYEKLETFCFLCGKLGHTESFCDIRLHQKKEELVFGWDASLRAQPRRFRRPQSSWIREYGKGGEMANLAGSAGFGNKSNSDFKFHNFCNGFYGADYGRDLGSECSKSSKNSMDVDPCHGGNEGDVSQLEETGISKPDELKKRQWLDKKENTVLSIVDSSSGNSMTISADPVKTRDSRKP